MWYDIAQPLLAWFLSLCWPCLLGCWAGMHFSWPCSLVRGSGQVCLGLVAICWGCLTWVPGKPSIYISLLTPTSLSLRGPSRSLLLSPEGLDLSPGDWSAPFFKGMPTRLQTFLEPPRVCGFEPYARTHLKKALSHTRLFGWTYDKYQSNEMIHLSLHTQVNGSVLVTAL